MLMRNPTRIEFKVEDAQARARHSRLGLGLILLVPAGIHPQQGETKATESRTDLHIATRPESTADLIVFRGWLHCPTSFA